MYELVDEFYNNVNTFKDPVYLLFLKASNSKDEQRRKLGENPFLAVVQKVNCKTMVETQLSSVLNPGVPIKCKRVKVKTVVQVIEDVKENIKVLPGIVYYEGKKKEYPLKLFKKTEYNFLRFVLEILCMILLVIIMIQREWPMKYYFAGKMIEYFQSYVLKNEFYNILKISPVIINFAFGPIRVKNIFNCKSVAFCASSKIT